MSEVEMVKQIELTQPAPGATGKPTSPVAVHFSETIWSSPGTHLASRVASRAEVRLILERLERDRFSVFVVLDEDPEDLLDAIFDAEEEIFKIFRGIPFDLRVIKPTSDWSDQDLRQDTICRYDRAIFRGR